MRLLTAIATSVAGALAIGAIQESIVPDLVVQREYTDPTGRKIEGRGVCEVTVSDVGCWDMEGRRDSDMADQLKAHVITQASELQFNFRKKNRYLALRRSGRDIGSSFRTREGRYVNQTFGRGNQELEFYRYVADNDAKVGGLITGISREVGTPQEIPFTVGQSKGTTIDLELGKPSTVSSDLIHIGMIYMGGADPSRFKVWSVPLQVIRRSADRRTTFGYTLLDKDRRPIQFVDRSGNIVPAVKYLEATQRRQSPLGRLPEPSNHAPASFYPTSQDQAAIVYTNVNPSKIGYIRVTSHTTTNVLIEGFPLDPVH